MYQQGRWAHGGGGGGGDSWYDQDPLGLYENGRDLIERSSREYDRSHGGIETNRGSYDENGDFVPDLPTGRKWEDVLKGGYPGSITDEEWQQLYGPNSTPPQDDIGWNDYINQWREDNPTLTGIGDFLKYLIPALGLGSKVVRAGAKAHDAISGTGGDSSDPGGGYDIPGGGRRDLFDDGYVPPGYRTREEYERRNDLPGRDNVGGDYPIDEGGGGAQGGDTGSGGGGPFPPFSGPTGAYDYGYGTSPVALTGPQANPQGSGGFDIGSLIQQLMQNGGK